MNLDLSSGIVLQPLNSNELINFNIANIPLQGILSQTADGFVYLKISDKFIYSLFPLIPIKEKRIPPYFSDPYNIGAHISIIYKEEIKHTLQIKELGNTFNFKINQLYKAQIKSKLFFILMVNSPELTVIRETYGFPHNPVYHNIPIDLHITIAMT